MKRDAGSKLATMVDLKISRPPGVEGEWWTIYIRGGGASHEQGAIGVAFLATKPVRKLYHELVPAAQLVHLASSYSENFIDNMRWLLQVTDEALKDGHTISPVPGSIIYDQPKYGHFDSPAHAIQLLWKHQINFLQGQNKPAVVGGILPDLCNADAQNLVMERLRYLVKNLHGVKQHQQEQTIVTGSHVAAVASGVTGRHEIAERNVLDAALTVQSVKKPGQHGVVFWLMPGPEEIAQKTTQDLIARLHALGIETVASSSADEIAAEIARLGSVAAR